MPMGVLAPGSAHAGPFAQLPIDMIGNFPAKFAFNHLTQPLRSHIRSFRTPREVFLGKKNSVKCKVTYCIRLFQTESPPSGSCIKGEKEISICPP